MISFKKICWKNFLSFGNYWTELDFDKDITVIVGSNGAGKSTFLDCLSFVLFGKTFRKINKPQVVNSITKKCCFVDIDFEAYGHHYRVCRGMKPNVFDIYKDGSLVPQDAATGDYQDYLETEVLRCNHKTFCQMVILGAANYTPFFDMMAADRRRFVEAIFDLEIISMMNVLLKKDASATDDEIRELERRKSELEFSIAEAERQAQKSNEKIIQTWSEEIEQLKLLIKEKEASIEDRKNKIKDYDVSLVTKLGESFKKHVAGIDYANRRIGELDRSSDFLRNHSGGKCPSCDQSIDEETALDIIKQNYNKKVEIEEKLAGFIQTKNKIEENILYWSKIKEHNNQMNIEINFFTSDIEHLEEDISKKEKQIEKIQMETPVFSANFGSHALDDLKEKLDSLHKQKQKQDILLTLLKDDGVKATILKDNIDIINGLVNKYLAEMDFFCSFNLNENFEEVIKSRYRDEFSYHSFSQGERLRITLALLLTWREISKRRNSIDTNLLIFDEILDSSLDQEGVNLFFELIKKLLKDRNVFIISHNQESIQKINNVIKVSKNEGFSYYEKE